MAKTKDRILTIALDLFNQYGTGTISTNHIADAAGISPGNLYYHFRNKEAIIRALFEQLFEAWDVRLTLPTDRQPTWDEIGLLVQTNFDIMWEYRFVYRETLALLQQDPQLHERYIAVRRRGYEGFRAVLVVIAPDMDAITVKRMADLCWLISEYWLPTLEQRGDDISQQHMQDGIDLMMQVLRLYLAR